MNTPILSIIIPTLNEAEALPQLLGDLAGQHGLPVLEVIVADGGSADDTVAIARQWFADGRLTGRCLSTGRGRGRQLNAGAKAAQGEWLLFLHADSRLPACDQLGKAFDALKRFRHEAQHDRVAGRFALRFDLAPEQKGFGYYFYEAKARLGRPGCVHGDQGLMLPAAYFDRIGPFREDLPVMEDTSMAETIRATGLWLLLPGTLLTSPRRFETEGMRARQTLNALMMNFLAIGWPDFFVRAPELYRQQANTGALQLGPFFGLIRELLAAMPAPRRRALWQATGAYVRGQAWQIGLARDCWLASRTPEVRDPLGGRWLVWFDRWFDPLTDHQLGRFLTTLCVKIWFVWCCRGQSLPQGRS